MAKPEPTQAADPRQDRLNDLKDAEIASRVLLVQVSFAHQAARFAENVTHDPQANEAEIAALLADARKAALEVFAKLSGARALLLAAATRRAK